MVTIGKPLEHFTYNLASIEGLKYVDVKISNTGGELSAPYKQLVITVTVQTDQISLQVPIHVAINSSSKTMALPLSPSPTSDREVNDADREALAELRSRITGRGKVKDVHLLFLKKLYDREPNTSVAEATRALLNQFKDLQITNSGVRHHLTRTLGIDLSGGSRQSTGQNTPKPMDTTEEFFDTPVPDAFVSGSQIQNRHFKRKKQ
jgi:hypothetical protein